LTRFGSPFLGDLGEREKYARGHDRCQIANTVRSVALAVCRFRLYFAQSNWAVRGRSGAAGVVIAAV
jgi:hypothetical protein